MTTPGLFTTFNKPGFRSEVDASTSSIFFTDRWGEMSQADRPYLMDSAAVDSGNTPTTLIRGGNVLSLAADGEVTPYTTTGNLPAIGILASDVDMLESGSAVQKWVKPFVKGNVRYSELLNITPRAARQLCQRGFVFDEPHYNVTGDSTASKLVVTADLPLTATAADNGTLFVVINAGTINLPAPSALTDGLYFYVAKGAAGAVTVGGGASSILLPDGSALAATDVVDNGVVRFEVMRTATSTYAYVQSI
ncbi:MAG TPA: hypothetical protein VMW36_03730 [Patescibacteria group bacterium]|nr:hypothetical protein [Patescibacteria group bacterium]